MTDKATYRRRLKALQRLKTWQLLILLLLGVLVSATLLRMNNLGMVERRSAVIAADETGDKEQLKSTIVELQRYVTKHMNTDLGGGFFLTKTYERDRDQALASANQSGNPGSTIYQQASLECRSQFRGGRESFRNDYVQCVIQKVGALDPQTNPEDSLKLPKADAYRVDFSSPFWSFDLAGIAVAFCVLITGVIIGRFLLLVLLKLLLRRHYRSI